MVVMPKTNLLPRQTEALLEACMVHGRWLDDLDGTTALVAARRLDEGGIVTVRDRHGSRLSLTLYGLNRAADDFAAERGCDPNPSDPADADWVLQHALFGEVIFD